MSGPERVYNLRKVDIHAFTVKPDSETVLRSRIAYGIGRGTGTTAETRDAAQLNVPTSVSASWQTNAGRSGAYGAPNPPPQKKPGPSWTTLGAGVGATIGSTAGMYFGRQIASALGSESAPHSSYFTTTLGAAVGTIVGGGLGALADYVTAPRYDAGHMLPRQVGGAGHTTEATFGQNPQYNRGNLFNGNSTFDTFRRKENELTEQMRNDGGGIFTFKTHK